MPASIGPSFARPFSKPAALPPALAKQLPPPPKPATSFSQVRDSFQAAPTTARAMPNLSGAAPARPATATPAATAPLPRPTTVNGMQQSHRIENGTRIHAQTEVRLPASSAKVKEQLLGDWSQWWQHSEVKNLQKTADGGAQFDFKPLTVAGQGPTQLNVKIAPGTTEKLPNGHTRTTMPVQLEGDFNGRARFELDDDGKNTTLRSVWEGVEPAGWKRHVPDVVAGMHMRVEAGNVPGLKNTGFKGLEDRLVGQLAQDERFEKELARPSTTERLSAMWSNRRALNDGDGIRSQNRVLDNGKVHSRTAVDLNAAPQQVQAAVQGSWDTWWGHSKIENRSADGKQFSIYPLGSGPKVDIKMQEPKTTVGPNGLKHTRIDADFGGDFSGRGHIDIEELPGGRSRLSFNWPDFEVTGALKKLPSVAIQAHTLALEGDVPGRDGTGLEGLVKFLKGGGK